MRKVTLSRFLILFVCLLGPLSVWADKNKGDLSNLVCFVRFLGESEEVFEHPSSTYEQLFNDATPGTNSVYNYFYEASYGQLSWKSKLFPAAENDKILSYQTKREREYYKEKGSINDIGYADEVDKAAREQALIREIADYLSSELPDDVVLDADNNGIIDNLCIILSGRSELSNRHLLWPHRSDLALPDEKAIYVKGKKLVGYLMVFDDANGWASLEPIPLNTGVLCHEMSHSLGTYDLYHVNDDLNPVGVWDLMSDNLVVPQQMSAYTKYRYCGWLDDIPEISEPGTYVLNPLGGQNKENVAYKICPIGSEEYFIVEYRKKEGTFDVGLPESGLLVYRINPNFTGGNVNYNGSTRLDEVYIFRPGGTTTTDGNVEQAAFSSESGRNMFGGTADVKPFYSDGTVARFALTNISACGETLSFDLEKLANQIKLSEEMVTFTGKAGEKLELTVESDVDWLINEVPDWLKVSQSEGQPGETKITLETLSSNETTQTRSAELIFTSSSDTSLKTVLKVSQQSDVLLPPSALTAAVSEDGSVKLEWAAPQEGQLILFDGFEDTENPNGWTIQNYGDRGWTWQQAEKNYMPYSGNYSMYMKSAWEDVHQDERLISPVFSNGQTLTFYSKSIAPQKTVKNQYYFVEVSQDGGVVWEPVYDLMKDCDVVNDYVKITIDLSAYQSDRMRISFHAYDSNNIGLSYWWQIDDVNIYSASDEAVIKGYAIYRNGVKIGESTECTYTDTAPLAGENIYTVRALSDFGETSDSEPVSVLCNPDNISQVTDDADMLKIRIDNRVMKLNADAPLAQVELFAMDGTCLYRQGTVGKEYTMNMSQYRSGGYILVCRMADTNKTVVKKVLVP